MRAAWSRSWWASSSAGSSRAAAGAAREVAEADDRQVGLGGERLEVVGLGAAPGEVGRQVVVRLDQPAEAVGPEVLPAQPQLERPPAPRPLERALVEVELIGFVVRRDPRARGRLTAAVVLGAVVVHVEQVVAAADEQPADVVGLEEPLVRVDRDAVGPVQAGHPRSVARRQERPAAVGRVDVEPEASRGRRRRRARTVRSTEPVFVEPATAAIAHGRRPAARSAAIASATGSPRSRKRSSAATRWSVSGGKPSSSSARAIEKWVWSEA